MRVKRYDPVLTVLTTSWFGYQLQSIISINQIGLAIWGWVITGAAVAYERITRLEALEANSSMDKNQTSNLKKSAENQQTKALMSTSAAGVVGLLLALPPFTADSQWRNAQVIRSVEAIEKSMTASYFNPQNSMKYMTNIQILEQSNFSDLARVYALEAVKWNPEAYELWKVLYTVRNSNVEEKQLALENMKRLDPLNPELTPKL